MVRLHAIAAKIVLTSLLASSGALSQGSTGFHLKTIIPLPRVEGRIDHMDVDLKTGRVFVAALGNNTVEVVSLRDAKRLSTITGFHEPQGVLFLPDFNRLYVTNGGDGTCAILDGSSLERMKTLPFLEDADNIRYSQAERLVYVGFGAGGIAAIDPTRADTSYLVALQAHPESFQLESTGLKIYVNLPDERKVAVIDRLTRQVLTAWTMKGAERNFPMALDERYHRLFIGCRTPARLLILNADSGTQIAALRIGEDVDDIFFDAQRRRLYISSGEGVVEVISQQGENTYREIGKLPTRKGARTTLFIPQLNVLLVAVPRIGNSDAELRVYSVTGP